VAAALTSIVDRAALGSLELIASGGFGDVYLVGQFRLPGNAGALAYKEFTSEHDLQARAVRMTVDLRDSLDHADRHMLDELSVWPQALVENDSGLVCGLLMPLLPADFFTQLIDPPSGQRSNKPRDLAWLVASAAHRQAAGVDLPDVELTDRFVLLAQLCYVVAWLHRRGWVYGDLNLHNVAFALAPARIKLLDCDAAAPLRDTQRRQGHQAGWEPPEDQTARDAGCLQDTTTDVYKLGLAILRCLTPGKHASTRTSTRRLRGLLDPAGFRLVSDALSDRARPTARDLYCYLQQTAQARMDPPRVTSIRIPGHAWPRGQDIRIDWRVTGASEVVITTGNVHHQRVDPSVHTTGYTIRPTVSGPLVIDFRNRFAAVTVNLGQVRLYDLPAFPAPSLPAFEMPRLPAFELPDLLGKMSPPDAPKLPHRVPPVTVSKPSTRFAGAPATSRSPDAHK
jgi:hypothetical protein